MTKILREYGIIFFIKETQEMFNSDEEKGNDADDESEDEKS